MLVRCHRTFGNTAIVAHEPRNDVYEDVLYVPVGAAGSRPGIYDRGRKLVTDSGCFRGVPEIHPVIESYVTPLDPDQIEIDEENLDYIYAGHISLHYGHFLVSCLSRYWNMPITERSGAQFLLMGGTTTAELFDAPFVRDILGQLGLTAENFLYLDRPLRFRRLTIPAPSFEENNFAHLAFARLCHRIGDSATSGLQIEKRGSPAYLSKSKLAYGVSRIVNEDAVCDYLERRGVDIVFPETLDFRSQVALFRERPLVAGVISSALHTGIFTPQNRILVLNHGEEVWSNQLLLDGINGNDTLYLHPKGDLSNQGRTEFFHNNFVLQDPTRTASEFLRAIDAFMAARKIRRRRWDEPGPEDGLPKLLRPEGCNLAREKPAKQSSRGSFSKGRTPEEDATGAVSGLLTGYYQFHTDTEDQPWWQVDLLQSSRVSEIRIYNRLDLGGYRAARFVLLGGPTEESLTELTRREDETPFGGLDGLPFIWTPSAALVTRLIRIQSLIHDCFHLDQVEVFGEAAG